MDKLGSRRLFHRAMQGGLVAGWAALTLGLFSIAANGQDCPWILLSPQNDSRDADMCELDEAWSMNLVNVINANNELLNQHLTWGKCSIKKLLSMDVPFCELHFDAINPVGFTAEEKSILAEYLKRGGFILFFIDTYPYAQEDFWKVKQWPVIDFLTRELPASDPDFTTGKATDNFDIFKVHYLTETADSIRHELEGNPNTPNRTLLFYRNRLCCFVMGRYSYLEDNTWVGEPKPFIRDLSSDPKSYQLVVNVYIYAVVR